VNWYRKAADQGNAAAQSNLATSYRDGVGVTKDEQEAVNWYRKAAELGLKQAKSSVCRGGGS